MKYGYARVSTDGQSVDAQVRQLTKAGCKKVFREVGSRAKTDRAQLRRLLDQLDAGDDFTIIRGGVKVNVERLREVVDLLIQAEEKHKIQELLDQLRAHIQQLSSNPQDQTVQKQFADALEALRTAMAEFKVEFT